MRYVSGEPVRVGDIVAIAGDASGVVVGLIENGNYRSDFVASEWAYLQHGVLVVSNEMGLIHYPDDLSQLSLVSHAANTT